MKSLFFWISLVTVTASAQNQVRMVLRAPLYFDYLRNDTINPKSMNGLAFYQGLKLGLDSLSHQGLDVKLDVIDEEVSGDSLLSIKPWTEVEMVLTPTGKIHFFTGKKYGSQQVELNAPMRAHLSEISNYLFHEPGNKHLLMIHRGKPQEKKILQVWKDELKVSGFDSIPELVRADLTGFPLEGKLKKGKVNYVLVPSADQSFVANVLNRLQSIADQYTIVVVGLPNWMGFGSIEPETFENMQLLITSEKFVDYQRSDLISFRRLYQEKYFNDPIDMAFRGFDAALFWGKLLMQYPSEFDIHLGDPDQHRLVNDYILIKDESQTWINQHVQLLQITPHGIARRNR